ncbi:MAG TPA: ParB/RepB/Spo0J family partition protein [Firmicutes bacterium]|nr:ParB/RepB/Spo0J family partition protein [Bacillota bacterium]
MSKPRGLGKGLGALIPQLEQEEEQATVEISVHQIVPNPFQPRQKFNEELLNELAASIKTHGVLQPLLVRKVDDQYQLIAGERRLRASKLAGLTTVPVIIKDFSDQTAMEIALVENLQREDLSPLEEAEAYKRLIDEFSLTQEQIAQVVGKSRSAVANMLRLLNLTPEVRAKLENNKITMGHARALLALETPEIQIEVCQTVIQEELNVRETEKLINRILNDNVSHETISETLTNATRARKEQTADPNLRDITERLTLHFGTKISIKGQPDKGRVEIEYYSQEEFERILDLLLRGE